VLSAAGGVVAGPSLVFRGGVSIGRELTAWTGARGRGIIPLRAQRRAEAVTAAELVRIMRRAGWEVVRQRGSHQRLENPRRSRNSVTIAVHGARDIPDGTLRAILGRAGLSREEFEALRSR